MKELAEDKLYGTPTDDSTDWAIKYDIDSALEFKVELNDKTLQKEKFTGSKEIIFNNDG